MTTSIVALFIIVVLLVGIVDAWKSLAPSYTYRNRSMQLMAEGKTPLVANGKRVEADPGSSLMAVRYLS